MFQDHPFWWLLTAACLIWYSTLTIYIAIRGAFDIKHMLRALQNPELPVEEAAGTDEDHILVQRHRDN